MKRFGQSAETTQAEEKQMGEGGCKILFVSAESRQHQWQNHTSLRSTNMEMSQIQI